MQRLFTWFYCLPLAQALILILLATAVFQFLRKAFEHTPGWRVGIRILFLFWLSVIFLITIGQRTGGETLSAPILTPFYSYYAAHSMGQPEVYRTNFMNAFLFYPAGLLTCELLPGRWRLRGKAALTVCAFALMSAGIEFLQFRFGLGLAETDDVIHNALGALLGALAWGVSAKLIKKYNHKHPL